MGTTIKIHPSIECHSYFSESFSYLTEMYLSINTFSLTWSSFLKEFLITYSYKENNSITFHINHPEKKIEKIISLFDFSEFLFKRLNISQCFFPQKVNIYAFLIFLWTEEFSNILLWSSSSLLCWPTWTKQWLSSHS